jgi:hypothetical protein
LGVPEICFCLYSFSIGFVSATATCCYCYYCTAQNVFLRKMIDDTMCVMVIVVSQKLVLNAIFTPKRYYYSGVACSVGNVGNYWCSNSLLRLANLQQPDNFQQPKMKRIFALVAASTERERQDRSQHRVRLLYNSTRTKDDRRYDWKKMSYQ